MRSMRQNVFPEPGLATTRRGLRSASIAGRWDAVGVYRTHGKIRSRTNVGRRQGLRAQIAPSWRAGYNSGRNTVWAAGHPHAFQATQGILKSGKMPSFIDGARDQPDFGRAVCRGLTG